MSSRPVLWHLRISHYSEKIRWALDHKRLPHARRAPMPGFHNVVAKRLTGGTHTLPILELDGRAIGDSTAIIAALETHTPDPPLYPEDAGELQRALELEDTFDEVVGPAVRHIAFFHILRDPKRAPELIAGPGGDTHATLMRLGWATVAPITKLSYGIDDDPPREPEAKLREALDGISSELRPSGFLAGDRFGVADLTAAALLAPLTRPPGYPGFASGVPDTLAPLWEDLNRHPAAQWAREVYVANR